MENRLVLIDGHAILHRAYHALPKTMTNRHGQPTNAVYGFCRILFKVIQDLKPTHLAVAFDRPEPNFRHQMYLGYQVQRPKMDQELKDQISLVKEVLEAFSIPILERIGYEADDIIGTLARKAKSQSKKSSKKPHRHTELALPRDERSELYRGSASKIPKQVRDDNKKLKSQEFETIIVTGDRDIFQLIDDSTFIYAPLKGFSDPQMVDRQKTKELLGVLPEQIVDYKALVGDSSDNYPGVPGIGPKTAVKLLEKYQTLKEIYNHLEDLGETEIQKLKEGENSSQLSRKLAQIEKNVPVKFIPQKFEFGRYNQDKVRQVFQQLGFKSLINKMPGENGQDGKKEEEKNKLGEQMKLV